MANEYGYSVRKDNYGKSDNIERYKKLIQENSLKTSAVSAQNSAVNKSVKPTNPSDLLKRVTVTDYPTINKLATQQEQQRKEAERQEQERWNNLSVGEKITDPFKTMGANITYGDLGIKENVAWNEYRSKQDDASLQAAQAATKAREDFEATNDRIGKGNAVTKDFAQYLPQLGGQLKAGAVGAAGGAGAGAAGGAGIALAAGQLGPQVAVPEEIATVPAGALTGAIWGGRGGYVAGTAKYSYDMMAGSAYKTLLDMGVPNDVALELSGDEALVNSLIEGGGAIVDLISLGFGKLVVKGGTTAAKEVAKNRLLAAAKAYGLNLVSEPLEEMAQEKVSIETEKRAADKTGIERNVTSAEDWERIKGAGETALKVAAVSGGLNAGGNYITNNITENINNNRQAKAQINQDIQNYKNTSEKVASDVKNDVPNASQMQNVQQPNVTLPTQIEMAQKANMKQIAENRKNTLVNKINSNQYLSQQEKTDLISMLNATNMTSEVETEINNILNTVNDEFGLKNITSDFNANKSNYAKYLNDKTELNNSYIDNAKNAVNTKDGRRTKEQWLSVAKKLGSQIYEMSDGDVEKYAYRTWIENRPNTAQNLNRQGKKYVNFGLDEWVNSVYDSVRDARNRTTGTTGNPLPTQRAQQTLQSAKVAGANDIDMNKAIELNNLLRSGADVKFYNLQNIPQGVDANKAKVANGFYSNGTVWINKNTKNAVEVVLGHELTHHLETTDSYTDLANTILDSDVFYDYITEKGYSNVAEYKQSLGQNYTAEQFDSEMVANFVQDKLFSDQNSIDRLARQNATLVEKIKNWISDLVVSFKGTAQEKELRRIEGMYRKALEQARNTTASTDTQYSIAGVKAMENIGDRELTQSYKEAQRTGQNTRGWFKDKEGNWKFEFSDKDMTLKKNVRLSDTGNRLGDILEHDILFRAYPELRDTVVNFKEMKRGSGLFHKGTGEITLNEKLFNTQDWKKNVEASLLHEVQHAIQEIEGYPGAANPRWSKKAYYESLGEIEASDTKDRFLKEKDGKLDRNEIKPRSSEPNPKHRMYDKYMNERGIVDKIKDAAFPYYAGKGGKGYEILEEAMVEDNNADLRMDDGRGLRGYVNDIAGKEPAFSMPETDNQGRNQIKAVDNSSPTESVDIRYSMNPVEIAKNPPNPQSGLDPLQRMSREKEGNKQSSFTRNIYNQNIFDDTFKDLALDDKNIRTYETISNKETLQQANDAINEQGQKWVDRFLEKPNGEMKATDIAGGFILMNRYQQVGDYESMIRIAEKLRKAGTQQGQTIQMFSILGRMTPEGMTYYAQTELNKAYDEILKNKTQVWADEHSDEFKLKEKDIEFIQRRVNQASKLPEGRDKYVLLGEIAARIQSKIPPQAGQGLKALARNSMLLNPKTMVRNVLGNVVIAPSHITADFIGSGIDKVISKKTGVRTTGGFDVKSLKGVKKGFYDSFDDFRRKISTREMGGDRFEIGKGGKSFYENHTGKFSAPRNALSKALNGLDRVTGYLLESGDRPFYETWFINSLNNQMKLNNVTEPTAEMIEIATDEALQRTWQDNNTYTKAVNGVRNSLNKVNVKGYGLGDMVMPFVKTPANLTKSVVDFSPLGAINAAIKTSRFNKDISKGVATSKQQREVVKAWSQVITGTLGMAIMTALADKGILIGGSDDDKDVRSFEQNILGIKPYSIKIGDKTYTYDWAQPLGTSTAMVTDTVKSLKNVDATEDKVAALLKGVQSGASVLLDQSFVSGIRNLFEEDNLINALIETGFNEGAKFTPQFFSQLAQIQDDTARTSYVYNNIPQTAINKVKAKIPGLRQTLEPSVDVLGREVKTNNSVGNVMFNPANTAFARSTKAAEEMYSVYQETGDKATIAQVAPYYFNVNEEKIVLTPKQRTQYQKTTGKIASDGVENLLKNKQYMNLGASDKAEILKDLYAYGNAMAKKEVTEKYNLPTEYAKIKQSGMSPEEYILMKYISNLDGTKKDDMYNSLISAGYSQRKAENFLTEYKGYKYSTNGKDTLPTLSSKRSGLPTLNK